MCQQFGAMNLLVQAGLLQPCGLLRFWLVAAQMSLVVGLHGAFAALC